MPLNNLDIIILIVIGISALIALSRGLVKEVLSIIGWVLATATVIYLLPVITPFAKQHIATGWLAGLVAALVILILFMVVWILITSRVISGIRSSKLNGLDRTLGLFFGFARAVLLVILFYILISWIIPIDKQSETLTKSKYFQLAGKFAAPIEQLIPEETLKLIREKTKAAATEEEEKPAAEEPAKDKKETTDGAEKVKSGDKDAINDLFDKLAQPQIKKAKKEVVATIHENFEGYKDSERGNLDRLIENAAD